MKSKADIAHAKLLKTLTSMGVKVLISDREFGGQKIELNGIETYILFEPVGRFPVPSAQLKVTFGPPRKPGRLTIREPKKGFDFKAMAERVIAYIEQEKRAAAAERASEKIRTANTRTANRIRATHKLKDTGIRVYSYSNRKDSLVVEVSLRDISEKDAVRFIRAAKKGLQTIKP